MRRIAILTGYYGSGKTEVAANLAIRFERNLVIDLDVINPYFRSRELDQVFSRHGIRVLSSRLEGTKFADMPYIGGEVFLPFQDRSLTAIFDLGGNDLGAKLLRQFTDFLDHEEVDFYLVVNPFRMETATADLIVALIRRIEGASGVKITGLINNSNLLNQTDDAVLAEGEAVILEASRQCDVPVAFAMIPPQCAAFRPQQGTPVRFTRYFQFH